MRTRSKKRNKINVITLGCSKNIYDSEIIIKQLEASKKNVVHEENGNIVVINTCGFINNAKQESIDTILEQIEYKQTGIVDKVYVTGCLSERYKNDLEKEIPDVDQYFGTTDLPQLLKVLDADYKHELVGERILTTPKHYAYLKIAEGCDRPCSFCAIPLMRGKHRSTPIEKLVGQAKNLAKNGVKELKMGKFNVFLDKDGNELVPNYGYEKTIQPDQKNYQPLYRKDTVERIKKESMVWDYEKRENIHVFVSDPSSKHFDGYLARV